MNQTITLINVLVIKRVRKQEFEGRSKLEEVHCVFQIEAISITWIIIIVQLYFSICSSAVVVLAF